MSKLLTKQNLTGRLSFRAFLAVSLCASMAAFGCTTDRNLGNGDPVVTPGLRSSPTSGNSTGSESESVPPPMMSSFSNGQVHTIQPRIARMTADEAAAIMAQQQPRMRVLGPVSPGRSGQPYLSDQMFPQQQSEARYSVNSTLYSGPTEAILSGAGEPLATNSVAASSVDTTGAGSTGFTAASTIAGSSAVVTGTTTASPSTNVTSAAAPVIAPSSVITPTSNAVSAPTGFASVRTLSPTAAAVVNPPASISGSPALATTSSTRTAGATPTATRTGTTVSTSSVTAPATASVANPVRVMTTNGRLTITNTGTTRQQ